MCVCSDYISYSQSQSLLYFGYICAAIMVTTCTQFRDQFNKRYYLVYLWYCLTVKDYISFQLPHVNNGVSEVYKRMLVKPMSGSARTFHLERSSVTWNQNRGLESQLWVSITFCFIHSVEHSGMSSCDVAFCLSILKNI